MNLDGLNNLIRDENYINNLYDIREEMIVKNMIKLFGYTKDKSLSIMITKQIINMEDEEILFRIINMSRLVEENVILVENLWIEENNDSKIFSN